jgi:hypothetical protein
MKLRSFYLLLIGVLVALSAVMVQAQSASTCDIDSGYASTLNDRYGLAFAGAVSQSEFTDSLTALTSAVTLPEGVDLEGFTGLEAVITALYYANLDELAFTYPEAKVDEALAGLALAADLDLARRQELAAALDTGLFDPACAADFDLSGEVDADFATYLLGRVLEVTGQYKNYVGYTLDPDIYSRLIYAWNSFDQVFEPELQAPAVDLIRTGVITGYNLKRTSHNANFDPEMSIVYGHANINHARQLIGLLRSEGINARVLLEPKTSAFLYLAEWGTPSTSPSFQVEALDDGNYIAYAKEYDLAFEFLSIEDRDRFDALILAYADKDAADEPGLLLGSWWQPLYSARVPLENYVEVRNNVVYVGQFYLQSFSLIEDSDAIIAGFEAAYPDGDIQTWDLWVNVSFHNYLLGLPN